MFKPQTTKISELAKQFPGVIKELEKILSGSTNIYIDYANVIHWQDKLGWHIDEKRLRQFLRSFNTVKDIKIYSGTLMGDAHSEEWVRNIQAMGGYTLKTKPVKIMKASIDVSSVPLNSPVLLERFIKKSLLSKLNIKTVEFLNGQLQDLNKQGVLLIEERKCNFDVEIGRDMLLDFKQNNLDDFILWSGDSDFADPVQQLIRDGKKVFIFATVRRVSAELANAGAPIFDIMKIKEFICWWREVPQSVKSKLKLP